MSSYRFLQCLGKALLNAAGGGVLGDVLVEVLPEVAKKAWNVWSKEADEEERVAQLEELTRAPNTRLKEEILTVVRDIAGDQPPRVRQDLVAYLSQVPGTLRQTFRRPGDPSGKTVPPSTQLRNADDLITLLPTRLPRFKAGTKPFPGVDLVLEELLGVGGFGEVWKARNSRIESMPPVALKFCLDEAARDRLLAHEAKVLAHVMKSGRHPGIVELQNTFLDNETPCLQYEYVAGGDLTGYLNELYASEIPPSPKQIGEIMLQLCDILAHAHKMRPAIVHRDLKPANILVQKAKQGVTFKIADFGIGGLAASQAILATKQGHTTHAFTMSSALRGAHTPLYASPQQVEGKNPDPRDDVFSLGVIWYQALLGDLSVGRPGGQKWRERLEEKHVPRAHIKLISRCFEDNPDDRPAHAGVIADGLRSAIEKKRTTGEDAPEPKRKGKKEGSNRLPLVLGSVGAGVAFLLLLILVLVLSGGSKKKNKEEAAAETKDADKKPGELSAAEKYKAGMKKGDEALEKNDFDAAIAAFSEVIALDAMPELAYFGRARAHQGKNDFAAAHADWSKVIELNPKNVRAYEQRALAAYPRGDLDLVIADATKAFDLVPPPTRPIVGALASGAVEKPARLLQLRAVACSYRGDYPRARGDCTTALRIEPENAELLNLRGIGWANEGNYDQASQDYTAALTVKKNYAEALFNRGVAQGGLSRRNDLVLGKRVEEWRLSPQIVWAYPDRSPVPVVKKDAPPTSDGNGVELKSTSTGAELAGFSRRLFGRYFGQSLEQGASLLLSPLPNLLPPALPGLEPAPLSGPPLPLLDQTLRAVSGLSGPSGETMSAAERAMCMRGSKGDAAKASEDLLTAVPLAPKFAAGHLNLGWASYGVGNLEQAVSSFKEFLKLDDNSAVGHYYCGLAQLGQGDHNAALKSFGEAIRIDKAYPWPYKDRAIALTALRRYDEAQADLLKALKLAPDAVVLWYNAALFYLHIGVYDQAQTYLAAVLKREPKCVPAYLASGMIDVARYDLDSAITMFNQALGMEPGNASALVLSARVHELKGEREAAMKNYDSAVTVSKEAPALVLARAFAKCQGRQATTEDIDAGIVAYTTALKVSPNDVQLPIYLAMAQYRKRDFNTAERLCDLVLKKTENRSEIAYLLRGVIQLTGRKYNQALADFNAALDINSRSIHALLFRAEAQYELKKPIDAVKSCDDAVRIDVRYALAFQYRGWLHLNVPNRSFKLALDDLNRAVELEPTNPAHYKLRAVAHMRNSDLASQQRDLVMFANLMGMK